MIAQKINQIKKSDSTWIQLPPQPQLKEQNVRSIPDPIQLPYELTNFDFDNAEDAIATLESVGNTTDGTEKPVSWAEYASKNPAVKKWVLILKHACQCREAKCQFYGCLHIRKMVAHSKNCENFLKCKVQENKGCPICKPLIALCTYHAKVCNDAKCPMQFCLNIKQNLKWALLRHQQNQLAEIPENVRIPPPTDIFLETSSQIDRDIDQIMQQEIRKYGSNQSHDSMQHQNQPEQSGSTPLTFEHNVISAEAAVEIARNMVQNIQQEFPNTNTSNSIQLQNPLDQSGSVPPTLEHNVISAEAAVEIAREMVQKTQQEFQNPNTSHSIQLQDKPDQSGSILPTLDHNVISAEAAVKIAREMVQNTQQEFQNQNQNPNTSHSMQHQNRPNQSGLTPPTLEHNIISAETAVQIARDMVNNIGQEFQNQPPHSIQHQNQHAQSESTHSTLESNNISFEAAVQNTNAMAQNQNQPNQSISTPGSSGTAISSLVRERIEQATLPNNLENLSATPMLHVREWHGSFDMRSRNYLVQKM